MEAKTQERLRKVLYSFEVFGNLILGRKQPPWIEEKADMDKNIRSSVQYGIWRDAILKRDNYTCVICGDDRRSELQVDHIKPFALFPELRFAIDNGRTLCRDCHRKTKTYGGKIKKWKR